MDNPTFSVSGPIDGVQTNVGWLDSNGPVRNVQPSTNLVARLLHSLVLGVDEGLEA